MLYTLECRECGKRFMMDKKPPAPWCDACRERAHQEDMRQYESELRHEREQPFLLPLFDHNHRFVVYSAN